MHMPHSVCYLVMLTATDEQYQPQALAPQSSAVLYHQIYERECVCACVCGHGDGYNGCAASSASCSRLILARAVESQSNSTHVQSMAFGHGIDASHQSHTSSLLSYASKGSECREWRICCPGLAISKHASIVSHMFTLRMPFLLYNGGLSVMSGWNRCASWTAPVKKIECRYG